MIDSRRDTLANGLRVIYLPMPTFHAAIGVVYVRMGPRFETAGENGLSHFVEHVLFKGTEKHPDPESLSREIDAIGGELNGATMPEYTELVVSCHRRHFLRGLDLLFDVALCPRFEPQHVETERAVVLEEMCQYRDVVGHDYSIDELSYELMWPRQAHAFSCLGPEGNVQGFTRQQIEAHYRRFLKARGVVVCVAGNFDQAAVEALIAERFGGLEGGGGVEAPALRDEQRGAQCLFRRVRTRMAYLKLCHKACSYHDPRLYPVLILSDVLGGGVTSRLFARLRERDGLVYDVSSNTTLFSDCGWLDIVTTTSRGKLALAVEASLEEIRRLADQGVGEDSLQSIKDRVACQMEMLEDSPPDVADWFGVREILLAPERLSSPAEEAERLKRVTADQVRDAAADVFRPPRRSLVVVGPSTWGERRKIRGLVER
ncbi:MAG: M16 family metallopeptidase [Planctomycetota bacterium]